MWWLALLALPVVGWFAALYGLGVVARMMDNAHAQIRNRERTD